MPASILLLAPRRPGSHPVTRSRTCRRGADDWRSSPQASNFTEFPQPEPFEDERNALFIEPLFAFFRRVPFPSSVPSPEGVPAPSDAELMAGVARGDEAAFAQLFRRFAPGLFSLIHEIVGESEAEDVLQEAFVQMWKRAASYDATRSSAFTWAVMITRHKAIDRLRSRQRGERGAEILNREGQHTQFGSEADSGSTVAARHDDRARVLAALAKIPAEQREAIHLAFFRGLTHTAISGELQTPLGTVKARIRRGLLALQTLLAKP